VIHRVKAVVHRAIDASRTCLGCRCNDVENHNGREEFTLQRWVLLDEAPNATPRHATQGGGPTSTTPEAMINKAQRSRLHPKKHGSISDVVARLGPASSRPVANVCASSAGISYRNQVELSSELVSGLENYSRWAAMMVVIYASVPSERGARARANSTSIVTRMMKLPSCM
jgi:hypothetical protein